MKQFLFCGLALLVFGLGILLILEQGQKLQPSLSVVPSQSLSVVNAGGVTGVEPSASLVENLRENLEDPLTRLFIQLILIIVAARLCGILATAVRQPAVVGEMIAGILLGPSLLGWLWPDFFHFVFPTSSLGSLRLFSQIGVCLFMFVVGMELDVSQLKQQARTAVLVSQASILFPYLLGVVSALFLFSTFAGPGTTFTVFALFIGISMSITAFPVLARILEERGLTKSPLGITALICAAMNDVTAWCILALVVAVAKAKSTTSADFSIGLVVVFVLVMLFWIKPRLPRLLNRTTGGDGKLGNGVMTGVNWIDSFALGALMNTRGLVELIALNIGYDLGILSPRIFAMLVIMALVTTCMTGPLLTLSDYLRARKRLAMNPA